MIDSKLAEKIKKDFLEFSGGFGPHEAAEEAAKYMDHGQFHVPEASEEELVMFFIEWADELDAQQVN